jgi:YHS domain-containing protein
MDQVRRYLKKHKNKTILLSRIESIATDFNTYSDMRDVILLLVEEGILEPVMASGNNGKGMPLYNKYRVVKSKLNAEKNRLINTKMYHVSSELNLEEYLSLPIEVFLEDQEVIDQIDSYIKEHGLPIGKYLPELSYDLTGDEKWIEKKGGKKILRRLKLYDKVLPQQKSDPLAFGMNKKCINKMHHTHLIIENKTPFLHILKHLDQSNFSTVIYGQGWKITSGLGLFEEQFPLGESHQFFYFGDIDKAGIAIYEHIRNRYNVKLAKEFYKSIEVKRKYKGKETQHCNQDAINQFIEELGDTKDHSYIQRMLDDDMYQPQEALSELDLKEILIRGYND